MLAADAGQSDLGFVKFPARGQEATILVAVGVAEHDFLLVAKSADQRAVGGKVENTSERRRALLQVLDRFEKRDDVDVELRLAARTQQAGLLEQQCQFEQVGDTVGLEMMQLSSAAAP